MKLTNHQFFDFLNFNTNLKDDSEHARLWKACKPTEIKENGLGIELTLPFQCQELSNDITPDLSVKQKNYQVLLRAFGDQILRLSIGFENKIHDSSPMLEAHSEFKETKLTYKKTSENWEVTDAHGVVRARINLTTPEIDHWSDLLPKPQESFDAIFYPDGKKEVVLSAYDQFFPSRMDSMCLSFIENNGKPTKATISFHAKADEKFVGTGERFSKMDLSGHTFQLKNQDGQGVNNKRTYKNIPFYMSSEMYGLFLHTSAYSKISLADFSTRSVQILVEEPVLDVFLIGDDTPEKIIYHYRSLTGFPSAPPIWSYGVWMSKMTYFSEHEVNEICERLRTEDFPCDVIHLDTGWFDTRIQPIHIFIK